MKRLKIALVIIMAIILCEVAVVAALLVMNNGNSSKSEQQETVAEVEEKEVETTEAESQEEVTQVEIEQEEATQSEMTANIAQDAAENVIIMRIEPEQEYTLPGDESAHTICIMELEDENYGESSVVVQTDVSTDTMKIASIYVNDAYVINNESNRCFLLLSVDICSDDFVLYVYEIEDGKLQKVYEASGLLIDDHSKIEGTNMILTQQLEVLGSYRGYAEYYLSENGELNRKNEMYEIPVVEDNEWQGMTVTKELPVTINGQAKLLPVGTKIRIIGTNDNGIALFRIEGSGEEGEISYTKGDGVNTWGICIDGIHDYEYFEMVPYAG